jgi:hypothetical protein
VTGMRKLLVHLNDEVMSRRAIELAEALAERLAASVSAVATLEPQLSGVGLSAETAAPTAPSPGACSTGCWRKSASRSMPSVAPARVR